MSGCRQRDNDDEEVPTESSELKTDIKRAFRARNAKLYGEPYDVQLARDIIKEHLKTQVSRAVVYVNSLPKPPAFGVLRYSDIDVVFWTKGGGVLEGDVAMTWYWQVPGGSANWCPDPCSALIAMIEAVERFSE